MYDVTAVSDAAHAGVACRPVSLRRQVLAVSEHWLHYTGFSTHRPDGTSFAAHDKGLFPTRCCTMSMAAH